MICNSYIILFDYYYSLSKEYGYPIEHRISYPIDNKEEMEKIYYINKNVIIS